MAVDILIGLQWGDEGKGKVVDLLAPQYDIVARFQGGPNAGHTLEFEGNKHVLHQIPSGIFRKDIKNVIGNGVVLDPVVFVKELDQLTEKFGMDDFSNLFISKRTQLILPTHKLLDKAYEEAKGKDKIGSTLRGIGPAYTGKIARNGFRIGDILLPDFKDRYRKIADSHKSILDSYNSVYPELAEWEAAFFGSLERIKKLNLVNTEFLINDALAQGQKVLAEGAQGSLLDIDFGTYPFVTSSNTLTTGACSGLGVAPNQIGRVFGVFKAYCTRVGSGPFPTELDNEEGEAIRKAGSEFGATTGRPRRCGWLDLPALKYAVMLNGVTDLMMMKADIMEGFGDVKLCDEYKLTDGTITDNFPYDCSEIAETNFKSFPAWPDAFREIAEYDELSSEFKGYIDYIEKYIGTDIALVSVGPDRSQNIFKSKVVV